MYYIMCVSVCVLYTLHRNGNVSKCVIGELFLYYNLPDIFVPARNSVIIIAATKNNI